jgi:hypothetical protein
LAPEEVLYLADLKIYIGRKFSIEGDVNDFSIVLSIKFNYGSKYFGIGSLWYDPRVHP